MRYLVYIILLYIFVPFNLYIDLIAILIFFIVFKEHEAAVLVLSFFAGLLIDLYYPVMFGLNTLVYVLIVQGLLYVKKYIAQFFPSFMIGQVYKYEHFPAYPS